MPRSTAAGLIAALALLALPAAPALAHDAVPLAPQGGPVELHGDVIPAGMDAELEAATARTALARVAAAEPGATTLAETWCGEERATDDAANASAGEGPAIKLVYARPADQPNRFATFAEYAQDDAREIAESFALAADGTKTVRFDTGTSCGARYVDVISIALPRTRAEYLALPLEARFEALSDDLRPRLASVVGKRDFLVYADNLPAGGVSGVATLYNDDRAGASNLSNSGGQFAFVFSFGSSRRTTAQHELGHNLGAVQDSAPHSTLAGHCYERYDVMCYADGGPRGTSADLVTSCSTASPPAWDCRSDDYFHPNPPAGSYLATHWNLYDSVYLCAPAECIVDASAPDAGTAAPVAPTPPPAPPAPPASPTPPSGGGGGGSGAAPTPPAPERPEPPVEVVPPAPPQVIVDAPAPAPVAALSTREVLAAVADRTRAKLRTDPGRARITLTAPRAGTLVARITLRGRTAARAEVAVVAGQTITLRPRPTSRAARRALHRAPARQLDLTLRLT